MLSNSEILSDSVLLDSEGTAAAEEFPKKSMMLVEGEFLVGVFGCEFVPNSTNPSLFVGTTISCFGIRTTPRL